MGVCNWYQWSSGGGGGGGVWVGECEYVSLRGHSVSRSPSATELIKPMPSLTRCF